MENHDSSTRATYCRPSDRALQQLRWAVSLWQRPFPGFGTDPLLQIIQNTRGVEGDDFGQSSGLFARGGAFGMLKPMDP